MEKTPNLLIPCKIAFSLTEHSRSTDTLDDA
jgi:hypothetical protein